MSDTSVAGVFCTGLLIGMIFMGVLEVCIPGIGFHDASKAKIACEKSLPRDQECVPNYTPSQEEVK